MMHTLKRTTPNKTAKRIGRGGLRGKTSGRGHKGQKQHGGHGIRAEIRDQIKKLPKLRGRGVNSNKSRHPEMVPVNVSVLALNFAKGETVSPITLVEKRLVRSGLVRKSGVKILGNGNISVPLTIEGCVLSDSAREKITQAGGTIA